MCLGMVGAGFAANHGITMGDAHAFSRPNITITAGDSVTWDSVTIITPHNVTCSSAPSAVGCFAASGTILDTIFADSRFVLPNSTNPTYFRTPGTYDYRCTLHAGMTGRITVNVGPLHHFNVTAVPSTTAGDSFDVTVEAKDSVNNRVTGYTGTVHFTSSDAAATLPANSTLVNGIRTFTGVILRTAGTRSITVNDTVSTSITGTRNVTVNPAATSKLLVTAPSGVSANTAFQVVVSARDPFNNLVPGYAGTVHFTSSDPAAILPADNTLASGSRNFSVRLGTAGLQAVTATDTVTPAITGGANVSVAAACSVSFSNTAAINTPVIGLATLYPSNIVVGGLKQTINGMSVTLNGISHTQPADFDVLLVGPGGQKMIIVADSGSIHDVSNISITFSDTGTALLPLTDTLTSGSFKPTNQAGDDNFSPPAPAGPYSSPAPSGGDTFASVFNGTDPNGTWSLYVVDDLGSPGSIGGVASGWTLTFGPPPNTFCNQGNISLPVSGTSTPYPSTIDVSGIDGTLRNLSVRFDKLTEPRIQDLDMLLVGPGGNAKMVIISDAANNAVNNAVVTLDDAGAPFPDPLTSGVFRPRSFTAQVGFDQDAFFPPAPSAPYSQPAPQGTDTFASVFSGGTPNGSWSLYVIDDFGVGPGGNIAGGWALTLDVLFNTTTTLSSSLNPSLAGDLVTFTANVASSGPIPTGTVTFKLDGSELEPTQLVDGTAGVSFQFFGGTRNISVTYNGDTNFQPSVSNTVVQTTNPAPTAISVASSLNPSIFGQAVTFTATVAESSIFTPTDTVAFLDGDTVLGTSFLNGSGVATLTTSAVGGGSRSITAVYNGDLNFAPSTSPVLAQTVLRAPTSTTLVASPNPSAFGSSVTFTATVSGGAAGIPTGTVAFNDGAATIGSANLNESGVATFSTSALSVGAHDITAVYEGSDDFNVSTSGTVSQTVEKATPSISLISFLNPADLGQEVTFRADVSSSFSTLPTGTVFFKDGQTVLGSATLAGGTVLFSTSTLTAGNHNITAGYDGDGNFKGNISPVLVQEIIGLESAVAVSSSPNPAVFGPPVTIIATVTSPSGAGTPSAGTVTFSEGAIVLGTVSVNAAGVASLARQLQSGEHTITATYNGGPVFAASTSAPHTLTINPSTARFLGGVFPSKLFFRFRELIGFQAQVISNTGGTVTGTVTLFEGDTTLGTATLDGGGRATIFVAGLSVGEHELRVVYGGDSNFPAGAESDVIIYNRSPRPR